MPLQILLYQIGDVKDDVKDLKDKEKDEPRDEKLQRLVKELLKEWKESKTTKIKHSRCKRFKL